MDKLWLLSRKPAAALVLPFPACKGIVIFSVERFFCLKFMSNNNRCSCPTTILALTSPS